MNVPERMTGAVEATEEKLKNYYQDMIYTEGSRVARFISSILTMIPIAAFMICICLLQCALAFLLYCMLQITGILCLWKTEKEI